MEVKYSDAVLKEVKQEEIVTFSIIAAVVLAIIGYTIYSVHKSKVEAEKNTFYGCKADYIQEHGIKLCKLHDEFIDSNIRDSQ